MIDTESLFQRCIIAYAFIFKRLIGRLLVKSSKNQSIWMGEWVIDNRPQFKVTFQTTQSIIRIYHLSFFSLSS